MTLIPRPRHGPYCLVDRTVNEDMKTFKFTLSLFIVITALVILPGAAALALGPDPEPEITDTAPADPVTKHNFYLPFVSGGLSVRTACDALPGPGFDPLPVLPPTTDRPADQHADLNLALRYHAPSFAEPEYVWLNGPTDVLAPKLDGLFDQPHRPSIIQTGQVYDWDWDCNCRSTPLQTPAVTFFDLETTPLETLHVPQSGYDIGWGYEVLVLYAEPYQITLKYTREDNVVSGYTVHLQDICVEARLLSLYESLDANGRRQLPALKPGQAFARAQGDSIGLAIRDTGQFMDPRSLKDWW